MASVMRSGSRHLAMTSSAICALAALSGCSLLAPSDDDLMGERGLPSKVKPDPPVTDGLVFWLDGAAEVDTVDAEAGYPRVERWHDLSGNGNDAVQSSSPNQPAWVDDASSRRKLPLFTKDHSLTISAMALPATGYTLLLLARPLQYASNDTPLAFGEDGPRLVGENDADLSFRMQAAETNDLDIPFAWVPGTASLTIEEVSADGMVVARVDGHAVLETRSVTPVAASYDVIIGRSAAAIALVALFDRQLSLAEKSLIEQAASERWACCGR
jgi:hypothetical protein